jgi:hypothetical protein
MLAQYAAYAIADIEDGRTMIERSEPFPNDGWTNGLLDTKSGRRVCKASEMRERIRPWRVSN